MGSAAAPAVGPITGPAAALSRAHSSQSRPSPVPWRMFSGAMLLPVWQSGLSW
jgi:hypothetical protein